ncbi:hypothetical protein Dde_2470 [Oleidesulfovibrio alaskensis G20]|jgi:hypothetical protein|uniref:Uncharacterized protein n=1 Tax=Oleidesulfovibrio alaskensis (strain ATCC BAA-1058 / DSM 17464 / G20) TaxID=207559 RepID=Q30YH9_OLEA2|nr:hypothetical protein [Oleidesulfovibrio alaskensis]ABB39267.1 hypothetical protein Dde_2470 [Oleidesulfovibrio alaskensis G20]MBG0771981.1 hypothetical protein [Oleidesulfovibrio alaskensis]MBL3581781.1 hypothetical protein [Oleidesulfovibrio alaskensis]
MKDYLGQASGSNAQGVVYFLYHDNCAEQMPRTYSDPLELLGDMTLLRLSEEQKAALRTILHREIAENGAEAVWRSRAYRKNIIHSFGRIV